MNCIGLFLRLQVMCSNVGGDYKYYIGLLTRLHVLHRIVGEITSTAYDCWSDYKYRVGLVVRLHVLYRIVGVIKSTL